jgi:hypothetical protein
VVTIVVWSDTEYVWGEEDGGTGATWPALSADRITAEDTGVLFDDRWEGSKSSSSSPGYAPEQVTSGWTGKPSCSNASSCSHYPNGFVRAVDENGDYNNGASGFYQPDRCFDQCPVQFREIAHHKCLVPPDLLHPFPKPRQQACSVTWLDAKLRELAEYLETECGEALVPAGAIPVVFVGALYNNLVECPHTEGGTISTGWVFISQLAKEAVVAHELGHALGIGTHSSESGNLMEAEPIHEGFVHHLNAGQCDTIRGSAWDRHNSYW